MLANRITKSAWCKMTFFVAKSWLDFDLPIIVRSASQIHRSKNKSDHPFWKLSTKSRKRAGPIFQPELRIWQEFFCPKLNRKIAIALFNILGHFFLFYYVATFMSFPRNSGINLWSNCNFLGFNADQEYYEKKHGKISVLGYFHISTSRNFFLIFGRKKPWIYESSFRP